MRGLLNVDWKAVLREPLLHFLLIGLALFLLYGVSAGGSDPKTVVVSQAQVDSLVREFQGSTNRPPSAAELSGLIESYVRDEIIYREGLSLALDRDDAVIKRRIRQKYDLIAEEQHRSLPTDEELLAYLKAHPESFIRPAVVSFDQIFFDPTASNSQRIFAAKAALSNGGKAEEFGDPSLLPSRVSKISIQLVASDFGDDFARKAGTAPVGQWVGPVTSSFGIHLLRVSDRSNPSLPTLDEVKAELLREWENDRRIQSRDEDYRNLRDNYEVVVSAELPSALAR